MVSADKLDDHLSVMYDSLPTKTSEIDDTADCVNVVNNPLRVQFNNQLTDPEKVAEPIRTPGKEETSTTTKETRIKTTDPVTKEVTETKRIVTEKTVTSTKAAHATSARVKTRAESEVLIKPKLVDPEEVGKESPAKLLISESDKSIHKTVTLNDELADYDKP